MKKNNIVSFEQRREIRRMIRESVIDQKQFEIRRELAFHEFKVEHDKKLSEGSTLSEANLLLLEVDFMKALGFGSISGLKQQFVTSALKDLGVPTNTLSGVFLVNLIENIGMTQLLALFGAGPGKCDAVVELLSKAAIETITEYGAAKLIAYVFEKGAGKTNTVAAADIERAMNTFIGAIGIEVANDLIYQYFKVAMLDDLADNICSGGIMNMIGKLKGLGSAGSAAGTIANSSGGSASKGIMDIGKDASKSVDFGKLIKNVIKK